MATISYPKQNVKYYAIQDVYLRADDATVAQYCAEQGLTLDSYKAEEQRFSNDGGLAYQYYGILVGSGATVETWNTEFGYHRIVTEIVYT